MGTRNNVGLTPDISITYNFYPQKLLTNFYEEANLNAIRSFEYVRVGYRCKSTF